MIDFKRLLGLTIAVWLGLSGQRSNATSGTPPASTNSGPRIKFSELVFDFGRIEVGKIVSHDFAFTNMGNQTLVIQDVRPACGCTTATNWAQPIAPGKSGTIPVLFNSSGMAGPVGKFLKVISNDPVEPQVLLQFTATIWKPIDILPQVAVFNFGPDSQTNETRVIRLISNLDEPVTLSEPVCTNQSFRARLKTVRAGKEFELSITILPPLGPGSLAAPITLKTSTPKMPVAVVTAYAVVQPALTVTPPRIFLPPLPLARAEEFTVTIRNNGTNALTLSEPVIDAAGASARLKELQPGRLFNLTVQFAAGFNTPPSDSLEARIRSNQLQSPTIHVPIRRTDN